MICTICIICIMIRIKLYVLPALDLYYMMTSIMICTMHLLFYDLYYINGLYYDPCYVLLLF